MTRTKKSPTSSSGKSTDVRPQVDTPKRSGSRIPVPLVTVDVDAIYRTRGLMPKAEA